MSTFRKLLEKLERGESLTQEESETFEVLKGEYGLNPSENVGTITALAEVLGVSRPTIYAWKDEGMPIEEDGSYNPEKVLIWKGLKKEESIEGTEEEVSEKVQWEIGYRKFKAKLAELAYLKEKGELLYKKDVERGFSERLFELRRGLDMMGRRIGARLAAKSGRKLSEVQRVIGEELNRLLTMYSREIKIKKG